ncbi:hypothetical protein HMPREF1210_02977 [Paenisporosarcina sp. HGH0030]|uniref:hypothetical protein n=1 Tax=Paenisporosarcina sp. HGH0030 TaxID=1078085 RepID=UPI00034E1BAF|nr:hypothetical protein [Paenisporosarcina sp. HGH0030]EPD50129.1 hypothetical protein HMPREF1210_02977 [Paenisporosarcina sp. HGH0030]
MKVILKFKNGDQIALPVASSGYWDIVVWDVVIHLKEVNEKDSPFEVVLGNGEIYESSGKELISVELTF